MQYHGRLLIIDDDRDARKALATQLRARGWNVALAATGALGLDAAAHEQPEVVIVELALPDVDGMQLARTLRTLVEHDIVAIALTRLGSETHMRAVTAGYDAAFGKPVDLEALEEVLLQSIITGGPLAR